MKKILLWIAVIIYGGLIWWMSSFALPPQPVGIVYVWDKLKHVAEFFILAILLFNAISESTKSTTAVFLAIIITAVYGIIDEVHQSFVPGRMFSYLDMASDAVGGLVISLFLLFKK